ncbi:Insulin-degrading enzyme [Nosema bombycis CQ1]|uniref:Insulin-degrading enzyme n=1 Tax=Nosema bombycis (strain CQ1 / CVCC 102059) TaxID=578461 RepID=R0KZ16_NOSB1|nr:Insulin-degrading enzyme [Nosema bombycis CQ1]|eukprot:EOB15422.1 Insulin-degrading enzyme [Nosema bombycis CQ1]
MIWFLTFVFCSHYEIFDAIERPKRFFFKLENDMPVLFIGTDSKYSRFSYSVNTGSVDDFKDCKGISHLLEHCLFGVDTELLKFIYDHGGSIIACTDESAITFEYLILKEYFNESLEILFRALNNPIFNPKAVNDEINLVDQEFRYRSVNNCVASNLCGEINELDVFTTGNSKALLLENIGLRLEQLYKNNFFKYNGSILCITDASIHFIQKYNLNYEQKPQNRIKKTLLTDYYNIDERLFLIKSSSNILFLRIKVPLEESPFLLNFLINEYLYRLGSFKSISKYVYSVDHMNIYHVVNINLFIEEDQCIHPRLFINQFIEIIKTTQIPIKEYESLLKETYNSVAKDVKPLDFLDYSNIHRYIQFKPYLFEKDFDKKNLLKFNKEQFKSLIKHLTDSSNYSVLYECDVNGPIKHSTYNDIPYTSLRKGCSPYYLVACDPKEDDVPVNPIESSLYCVMVRENEDLNQKGHRSELRSDPRFNPEDLIDINYNDFLQSSSLKAERYIEDDYYKIDEAPTYKIHYIHLKDTEDKILILRFYINENYEDFMKLIYLMGCLELALNNSLNLQRSNRATFKIKHNMLEVLFLKTSDRNHRLIVTKYISMCMKTLVQYLNAIKSSSDSLITIKMKEIAENVYGKYGLERDFRKLTKSAFSLYDSKRMKVMPPFYLKIGFLGRTNLLLQDEITDMVRKIKPDLKYTDLKKDIDGFSSSIPMLKKYSRFSLYVVDQLELSIRYVVVRLCTHFALYKYVESLRIDDKIGYHVFADYTSETYYSNFSIEGYSIKDDFETKRILWEYVVTVMNSLSNMSREEFTTFLEVVYNTYKLRSNNIKEIFHFCRSLDFQIDYRTFNEEFKTNLYSEFIKEDIILMLETEVSSLMD